jgi:hypothetical protein
MFVVENAEAQIIGFGDIYTIVQTEETIGAAGPARIFSGGEVAECHGVRGECGEDVAMELFYVHYGDGAESRGEEVGCPEGRRELFLREYRTEIVRIGSSVVPIPLFSVDVPSSSERIGLSSEASGAKADYEVELGEELRPAGLATGQDLWSREVFKVFMVSDNVNRRARPFQVVMPVVESLVNSKEFLIVSVVIEFRSGEGAGIESDGAELAIGAGDGEDSSDSVVGSVGFHSDRGVRNPMGEDRSGGESLLQGVKGGAALLREVPRSVLARQAR